MADHISSLERMWHLLHRGMDTGGQAVFINRLYDEIERARLYARQAPKRWHDLRAVPRIQRVKARDHAITEGLLSLATIGAPNSTAQKRKPRQSAVSSRSSMGTLPRAASGIAYQHKAGVTGETVTVTVVKGLVDRDCAGAAFADREGTRRTRGVAEESMIAARRPDGERGAFAYREWAPPAN
jgi:hypothetical protein